MNKRKKIKISASYAGCGTYKVNIDKYSLQELMDMHSALGEAVLHKKKSVQKKSRTE